MAQALGPAAPIGPAPLSFGSHSSSAPASARAPSTGATANNAANTLYPQNSGLYVQAAAPPPPTATPGSRGPQSARAHAAAAAAVSGIVALSSAYAELPTVSESGSPH